MKKCSKCKRIRKDKEFYVCPSRGGRLSNMCKDCFRRQSREREKTRDRTNRNRVKARSREKKYKHQVRKCVSVGYRQGYIPRSQCQDPGCSLMKVQGHHWDYMRPIDVIWVCQRHHTRADNDPIYEQKLINNRYNHNFYYINQYFTIEK